MKFVLIFGPQAVGKMTVGHELEKITELKLFHNHMTIDLVAPFFSYGTATGRKLVNLFREEIFKEVAKSQLEGIIFTYFWDFDDKDDWDYVATICTLFDSRGVEIYFIELEADIKERIKRNKSSHRLKHKPTKRNLEWSDGELKASMKKHRINSRTGEVKRKNYLRIDNTNLSSEKTARKIKEKCNF